MGVEFAGFECEAPDQLLRACQQASPPLPTQPWIGNANRFTSPVGLRPGYGGILIQRSSLNKLTSAIRGYNLTFTATPANAKSESKTLKNIRMVGTPIAISPGVRGDGDTTFFVELADRRVDCVGLCGKRYNWRIMPDCPYETFSLNTGTAWTWTELFTDLWDAVGCLGEFPGLPVTPTGTPDQIDGMASRASDVLEDLLLLNGMGVEYDNVADEFSIVSFAEDSSGSLGKKLVDLALKGLGAQLQSIDDKRLWDSEPLVDIDPKLPAYVRVAFPVWSAGGTPIDTATYYVVDVADTSPDSTRVQSYYALIQDVNVCRTNQVGVALNGSDLVARAAEVAANFYKIARRGAYYPFARTYSGIIEKSLVKPGANIDVVCWEDVGGGPKTHVIQTGRLGFAPLFYPNVSAQTSGALVTGNPFGDSGHYYRFNGSTNQSYAIQRVGNIPQGELRQYDQGPMASESGNTTPNLAGGGGTSSIMERVGPLRQWDSAVQARSVDGNGQRLWLAYERTQHLCFVKVTSITPSSGLYPAIEQLIAPITGSVTAGDVCWFYDPNTAVVPNLNSIHLAYLDGTDGAGTPKKVYMAGPGADAFVTKELDGTPVSYDVLWWPNTSLTDNGDGTVTVKSASATEIGLVSLSTQTMGDGDKTFQESVVVNSKKQTGEVIRVWGTGTTDPVILSADSHVYIGGATNTADLTVSDDLAVLGDAAVTGNATVTGTSNLYDDVTINPLGASGQILTVNGTAGPVLYTSNTGTHADGGSTSTGVTFSFTSHGDMLVDEGWLCQSSPIQAFIKAELAGTLGVDKKMTAIFSTYPLGSTRNQFSININGYESDGTPLPAVVMDFNLDSATVTQRNVMLGDGSGTSPVWGHHGNLGVSGSLLYGGTVSGGLVTNVGSAITPGSISGFDEAAQDAVGTILVDTATVNLTYTDGTPSITADVITGTSGTVIPLLDGNNTYSGTATFTAAFAAGDKVSFTGDITPTTLAANTNNWAPTNW